MTRQNLFLCFQGVSYIHQSSLGSHGSIRSSNCLINSRWQVKLTSFGLHFLKKEDHALREVTEYQEYKRMLWTAPELLRLPVELRPPTGTKAGDVYSFAIITQEILYRALPYFMDKLSPKGKDLTHVVLVFFVRKYKDIVAFYIIFNTEIASVIDT